MKALSIRCIYALALLLLSTGLAFATKPGEIVNRSNGFPSGSHYNLNLIGKTDGYTCPAPEYDLDGYQIYGNVIFLPQSGEDVQIVMQSGKGKKAASVASLQVTDWCTWAFDGDEAVMQLPKNDKGYRVYARALASPQGSPGMYIEPGLISVEDENGNDLVFLGLVTSDGFWSPYVSFERKKGKSKAIDITGLFSYSGEVCYLDTTTFCNTGCTEKTLCCVDDNFDGIYESCTELAEGAICEASEEQVSSYCSTYTNEWVFNIGEWVQYFWKVDNNGSKLVQIRFYPVQ